MRAVTLADTLPAVRWRPVWRGVAPKRLSSEFPAGADLRGGGPLWPARLHRQSGKKACGRPRFEASPPAGRRPEGAAADPRGCARETRSAGPRRGRTLGTDDELNVGDAPGGSTLEPARAARACASMGCQTRAGGRRGCPCQPATTCLPRGFSRPSGRAGRITASRRLRPRATWWDSSPRPRRRGGWQVVRTAARSAAPNDRARPRLGAPVP